MIRSSPRLKPINIYNEAVGEGLTVMAHRFNDDGSETITIVRNDAPGQRPLNVHIGHTPRRP